MSRAAICSTLDYNSLFVLRASAQCTYAYIHMTVRVIYLLCVCVVCRQSVWCMCNCVVTEVWKELLGEKETDSRREKRGEDGGVGAMMHVGGHGGEKVNAECCPHPPAVKEDLFVSINKDAVSLHCIFRNSSSMLSIFLALRHPSLPPSSSPASLSLSDWD